MYFTLHKLTPKRPDSDGPNLLSGSVKPPKRGHFGTGLFVPSSEVVPFWEVGPYLVFYHTI